MTDPTNAQRQRDWYARQKAGTPWQPLICQACGGNHRGKHDPLCSRCWVKSSRKPRQQPTCRVCGCVTRGAHGMLCSRCWERLEPAGRSRHLERNRRSRAKKRASTNPPAGAA